MGSWFLKRPKPTEKSLPKEKRHKKQSFPINTRSMKKRSDRNIQNQEGGGYKKSKLEIWKLTNTKKKPAMSQVGGDKKRISPVLKRQVGGGTKKGKVFG